MATDNGWRRADGPARTGQGAPARQRNARSPQKIFCGDFLLFSSVLFLSVKEKEPKRKLRNPPGLARCARPSAALALPAKIFAGLFFEKPRREKRVTDEGGGLPEGFRAIPSPIRFLFFGSFFSFPERKERTEKEKKRNVRAAAPPLARLRPNRGLFLI